MYGPGDILLWFDCGRGPGESGRGDWLKEPGMPEDIGLRPPAGDIGLIPTGDIDLIPPGDIGLLTPAGLLGREPSKLGPRLPAGDIGLDIGPPGPGCMRIG